MSRSKSRAAAVGAAVVLLASGALAAGLTGAEAAKDRHEHMKALGAAAKALFEQLHSGAPDKAVVRAQADKIEVAAKALPGWFPLGSGPEAGKTGALPVIWKEADAFAAAQRRFADAAAKLDAVADAGDMAAVGAAAGEVGGACKACHDKFRAPLK